MICSDTVSYTGIEVGCERKYKGEVADDFTALNAVQSFPAFEVPRADSSNSSKRPHSVPKDSTPRYRTSSFTAQFRRKNKKSNIEITVKESRHTVKVDNVTCGDTLGRDKEAVTTPRNRKHRGPEAKYVAPPDGDGERHPGVFSMSSRAFREHSASMSRSDSNRKSSSSVTSTLQRACKRKESSTSACSSPFTGFNDVMDTSSPDGKYDADLFHNIGANVPQSSGCDSNTSISACMSDININIGHRDMMRANSAPLASRQGSVRSCSSQTSIFESRMDYFRSCGAWKEIIKHVGKWKSRSS